MAASLSILGAALSDPDALPARREKERFTGAVFGAFRFFKEWSSLKSISSAKPAAIEQTVLTVLRCQEAGFPNELRRRIVAVLGGC